MKSMINLDTGYAYSQEDQSEHTQNFYRYAEN